MRDINDKKYKFYRWIMEVNMQKEAVKNQALRQCFSDSTKADIFNLSSSSGHDNDQSNVISKVFAQEELSSEGEEIEIIQNTESQIPKSFETSYGGPDKTIPYQHID